MDNAVLRVCSYSLHWSKWNFSQFQYNTTLFHMETPLSLQLRLLVLYGLYRFPLRFVRSCQPHPSRTSALYGDYIFMGWNLNLHAWFSQNNIETWYAHTFHYNLSACLCTSFQNLRTSQLHACSRNHTWHLWSCNCVDWEGKGKVRRINGQKDPEEEQRCSCTLSVASMVDESGWSTPRPSRSIPGTETRYNFLQEPGRAWGPEWKGAENLAPTGIRTPKEIYI
jgi:hypothetical protein